MKINIVHLIFFILTFSLKAQDAPVQAPRGQWELDTDTNVSIFLHKMDTTHKGKSFPENKALFTEKMPSGKKVSQERRGRADKDVFFKTDTSARPFHSRQKGYKLQVFYTKDRDQAYQSLREWSESYPDLHPQIVFQRPDYKIWLGNYKDKQIAGKDLLRIRSRAPYAFFVQAYVSDNTIDLFRNRKKGRK